MHAPLLYHFPGVTDPAAIPAPYAARFAGPHSYAQDAPGPGGARGLLIAPGAGHVVSYQPSVQQWDRLAPTVWLGARPGVPPASFARRRQFPGVPVVLGDGQPWLIPIANPFTPCCGLPRHERRIDGQWQRFIDDAYLPLVTRVGALATSLAAQVLSQGGAASFELGDDELRQLFADVLALNYDLTLDEISVLRLCRPETYSPVLRAFTDLDTLITLQAARRRDLEAGQPTLNPTPPIPATPPTAPGAPASIPVTSPAS